MHSTCLPQKLLFSPGEYLYSSERSVLVDSECSTNDSVAGWHVLNETSQGLPNCEHIG